MMHSPACVSAPRAVGLFAVGLTLSGCGRLDDVTNLTSPAVAQGIFVGLDLPEGVDISGSDLLQYSAACSVFLAYIADPAELADSPVEGASIDFKSRENGNFPLTEQAPGKYLVTAENGLVYKPGDEAVITTTIDGSDARMKVQTTDAPDVDIPETLHPEEGFTVDLSGQGYDNVLVAVYDVGRSKLTYENLPVDILETYTYTHADGVETLEVPGTEAFMRQGNYVVGVAGMRSADPTTFEGVSQTLSGFMAGQFTLGFVVVKD